MCISLVITFAHSTGPPRDQKYVRKIYFYTDRGHIEFDRMAYFAANYLLYRVMYVSQLLLPNSVPFPDRT